jgi:hypothetical protein
VITTDTAITTTKEGTMAAPERIDGPSARRIQDLVETLRREEGHVRALRDSLIRQRGAIAKGEAEAVNASADEIGRILLACDAARAERMRIVGELTGMAPPPLDRLEEILGIPLPEPLERERTALRRAARDVAREASLNRTVIARAIETGEAFLQAIFSSSGDPPAGYGPDAQSGPGGEGPGFFCNRKA